MTREWEPAPHPPLDRDRLRRPGESLSEYIDRVWPENAAAVAEVDRTLFQITLALSPIDRLEWATRAAWELEELREQMQPQDEPPEE